MNVNDIFICSGAMNFLKSTFHSQLQICQNVNREPLLDSVVFFPVHVFLVMFGHMSSHVSLVSEDTLL